MSGLQGWLAQPDHVGDITTLADVWRDQEAVFILSPTAPADSGFGGHLRRSYLGGLAHGASGPARAGNPCPWDPPCALDVFLREQLRAGSDGLPKPYVLAYQQDRQVMAVTLRVFGTACDWFAAAAESLSAGLTGILPWHLALHGQSAAPQIIDRRLMPPTPVEALPEGPLTLCLTSLMDDEGTKPGRDVAAAMLARAVRRVDAMARWQGIALTEDATRALTAAAHQITATGTRLRTEDRLSPNRHGQQRKSRVLLGEVDLPPLPTDLRLLLALACRTHLGRHTNEGLGGISVALEGHR